MSIEPIVSQGYCEIVQRISHIVADSEPDHQFGQMLELVVDVTGSQAGVLYLHHSISNELILSSVYGSQDGQALVGTRVLPDQSLAGYALGLGCPLFVADVQDEPHWNASVEMLPDVRLDSVVCLPLTLPEHPVGVMMLFHPSLLTDGDGDHDYGPSQELLRFLGLLLAPHIEKTRQLAEAHRRELRLMDLIDIMSCMSTTLERDRLLDDIMNYAQELLEVEATSIWIKDEETGDLILHIATGDQRDYIREVRVPADQGIIGNVVSQGKPIIVNDVSQDVHFYRAVDQQSGFKTRAIMCVPLQAPRIVLGGERGELQETIIGGAQALNKRDGQPFSEEDAVLFEMLANQSATILQLSELYTELARLYNELSLLFNETRRLSEQNYKMFWGIIKGITSFIDRKDPYTRGHSQRVAEFSVNIARELNLSREMIQHIHIGGILHDVGKIAVPDEVLKKPSGLTDEEMDKMKLHPTHGIDLLQESDLLWLLSHEKQAIEEHHERLDGSGYPRGLRGLREMLNEQGQENMLGISLTGRIVAVADAFDAMTSDRPYRPGMSAEKAIAILQEESGKAFDPECVEALLCAREKGNIRVQREREPHHQPDVSVLTDHTVMMVEEGER